MKKDPHIREDQTEDHNKIEFILMVSYLLKGFFLLLTLLQVSFAFGIIWLKFIDIERNILNALYDPESYPELLAADLEKELQERQTETMLKFIGTSTFHKAKTNHDDDAANDREDEKPLSAKALLVKMTYFSVTTLTTTGFGDISPQSAAERLFGAAMLLCGCAMFSFIMSMYMGILTEYMAYNMEVGSEEGYQLIMFMQCLSKLNGNESLDIGF